MIKKTAITFYKSIRGEGWRNYKLVNGLFIVKYIDTEISEFVGEFVKSGSARNDSKTNLVFLSDNPQKQRFHKLRNLSTSGLGIWRKLNIKFLEQPIEEILK